MNDGHLAVLQSGEQGFHGVFVADIAVIQTALQAAQGFQTGAWKQQRPDFCLVIFLELTHDDAAGRVVQHKEYRLVQNAESGGRVWTGGLPEPKKAFSGRISGCRMNATRGEIKIAALCREVYRRICSSHGEGMFLQRLISRVSRVLHPALIRLYPDLDETRRKWRLSYILSGCMGLISRWIREGMQESPEEVARELTALTEQNAGLGQRGVCCRGQGPGSRK